MTISTDLDWVTFTDADTGDCQWGEPPDGLCGREPVVAAWFTPRCCRKLEVPMLLCALHKELLLTKALSPSGTCEHIACGQLIRFRGMTPLRVLRFYYPVQGETVLLSGRLAQICC